MVKFLENYKIYYINLDQRKDRNTFFSEQMSSLEIKNYERIKACTEDDVPLNTLKQGNALGCRNVEIATSLSHINAIKYFVENSNDEYAMFCEDDADLDNLKKINFTITDLFNNFKEAECFQLAISTREDATLNFGVHKRTPWDFNCTVYLISKEYAKKIVNTYAKDGYFALDNFTSLDILDYRNNSYIKSQPTAEYIVYGSTTTLSCPLFSYTLSNSSIQTSDEHNRQNIKSKNDFLQKWSAFQKIEFYDLIDSKKSYFSDSILNNKVISKKITVVVPWRPTESRIKICDYMLNWYSLEFPEFDIVLCDSKHETFNLSASRNIGIRKAFNEGSDVVLAVDADFFPAKDSLIKAILNSINTDRISIPFNRHVEVTLEGTKEFLNKNPLSIDMNKQITTTPKLVNGQTDRLWICSGLIVITKKAFEELGEFDENYIGWGQEDIDYHKRYLDKYGRLFDYIDGFGMSLEHSRDEWKPSNTHNADYFKSKHGNSYIL